MKKKIVENIDFGNFSMNQNVIYKATTYLVTYVKLGFSQGVGKEGFIGGDGDLFFFLLFR